MTLYSRRDEAIHREIIEPLGEEATNFDIEAIADEMITWHDEFNNKGEIEANRSGFRIKEDIDFWTLVERHALD
ncbi:hypothetical protein I6J72_05385 [Corynebacterium sp. FDAARGOS 1242]|uniref:hypothetical protein n=1 Tax=Corynebacterium sp. FDAARGOS 1242 TaxID=2778078 RepID=UPI00194FAFFC|nr:hypothetical protein [Corynebacterium sp. FDAARGOS 1242]QRP98933.1 hypothetical protein I6J72_05385 [Corynebacterium sp. FDAARGOS 1242]